MNRKGMWLHLDLLTGSGSYKLLDVAVPQRKVITREESFNAHKENSICYYKSLHQLFETKNV